MIDLRHEASAETAEAKEVAVNTTEVDLAASIDPATVGVASDKLALIATLGDPSKPDKSTIKDPKTGKTTEDVIASIVGYQFIALADIEVPDCGTTIFYKSDGMDYIPEQKDNVRKVKKGEVFNLTHYEMAALLLTPEFNGEVTGDHKGSMKAVVALQKPTATPKKRPDGRLCIPLAYLRSSERGVSIRKLKQVMVLDVASKEVNGVIKREKKAKAGFEKWAPLAQSRAVTPGMVKTQSGVRDTVLAFASIRG